MKRIFFLVIVLLALMNNAWGQRFESVSSTSEKCFNSSDGAVLVYFTAGTGVNAPPYDIVLVTGTGPSASVKYVKPNVSSSPCILDNVPADVYTIRFRNRTTGEYIGNTFPATVGSQRALIFSSNGRPISVDGICGEEGQIEATVVGGNENNDGYTMIIKNLVSHDDYMVNATLNGQFKKSLPAGQYYIYSIEDSEGCKIEEDVSLIPPMTLNPSAGVKAVIVEDDYEPVKCYGANTGQFAVRVIEPKSEEYFFYLDGNHVGNSSGYYLFDNLSEGIYEYWVSDEKSCSDWGYVRIEQPDPLEISNITPTDVTCITDIVSNGTITVTARNGTPPYQYKITDGATVRDWQASNIFTDLPVGNYTVMVKDDNNCGEGEVTGSAKIENKSLTVEIAIDEHVSCKGEATGKAQAVVSNGSVNAVYSWTGPNGFKSASSSIENLAAGSYTVVVTADGCAVSDTKTINEPATQLTVTIDLFGHNICADGATGWAEANPAGGSEPYSYSWNTSPPQTTQRATGLKADTYTVTATDKNGCTAAATISINEPAAISLDNMIATPEICGNDGALEVIVSGGASPYGYEWNTGETGSKITGKPAGTYTVKVTDANGCFKEFTGVITRLEEFIVTPNPTHVSCNGFDDGAITLTVTGGNNDGSTAYLWTKDGVSTTWNTKDINQLTAGTYRYTVSNSGACTPEEGFVEIEEPGKITIIDLIADDVSCGGDETSLTVDATGDSKQTMVYRLNGGNWQTDNTFPVTAGAYNVQVGYQTETGVKCAESRTKTINGRAAIRIVRVSPPTPIMLMCEETSVRVTITAAIDGGGDMSSLRYNMGDGWKTSNQFQLTPSVAGYPVLVQYENDPHCTVEGDVVKIITPVDIDIRGVTYTETLDCPDSNNGAITVNATGNGTTLVYSIGGEYVENGGIFTGLTPGKYIVSVRYWDGNQIGTCAQTWGEIEIKSPAKININDVILGTVACVNDPPTTIKITATGEAGLRIEYSIDGGATWPKSGNSGEEVTFDNMTSGASYTVMARYHENCGVVTGPSGTIQAPLAEIKFDVTVDPLCADQTNTLMYITVSEYEAGKLLEYSIDGNDFYLEKAAWNVGVGTYAPAVRYQSSNPDSHCQQNWPTQVEIIQSDPIDVDIYPENPQLACDGSQTTRIIFDVKSFAAGSELEYKINDSSWETDPAMLPNVGIGTHATYVRYQNYGCEQIKHITVITDGSIKGITLKAENDKINLNCGEKIKLTVEVAEWDNNKTLQYRLRDDSDQVTGWQNTSDFPSMPAATYVAEVSYIDDECIQYSTPLTIIQPSIIQITDVRAVETELACNGDKTHIIVTADGHGQTLIYKLEGAASFDNTIGVFNDVIAGSYKISVMYDQAENCAVEWPELIVITEPQSVNIIDITGLTNVDCADEKAAVTVNATGNINRTMEYSADGINWQDENVLLLGVGVYDDIQVRYKYPYAVCGAVRLEQTVTITGPDPITIVSVSYEDMIDCTIGEDATITVIVTGEAGYDLVYSFDGGATYQRDNTMQATSGVYNICVAYGDEITQKCAVCSPDPVVIKSNSEIVFANIVIGAPIACHGGLTDLTVTVQGADEIEVNINGNEWFTAEADGSFTFAGLGAGQYYVSARNSNDQSCVQIVGPISIIEPAPVEVLLESQTDARGCKGETPGTAIIKGIGGGGAYEYSLNGGAYQPMPQNPFTITNLDMGDYSVSLKDAKDCKSSDMQFTFNNPDKLIFNVNRGDINCFGDASGRLTIRITQGDAPFTVKITAPATTDKDGKDIPEYNEERIIPSDLLIIENLHARIYTITVSGIVNGSACEDTQTVSITQPLLPLKLTIEPTNICPNESLGGYIMNTYGGQPGYKYYWYLEKNDDFEVMFDDGTGEPKDESPRVDELAPGKYQVIVADHLTCTDTTTFELIKMHIDVVVRGLPVPCNDNVGSIEIKKNIPNRIYKYQVRQSNGLMVQNIEIQSDNNVDLIIGLKPDTYSVSIWDSEGEHCGASNFTAVIDKENGIKNVIVVKEPECGAPGQIDFEVWGAINSDLIVTCNNAPPDTDITGNWDGSKWIFSVQLIKGGVTIIEVDDDGCIDTWEGDINYSTNLIFDRVETTDNECPDGEEGIIIAKASDKDNINWQDIYHSFTYRLYQGKATIYDNLVREIIVDQANFNEAVTFANLPNGQYTLSMEADNGCFTKDEIVEIVSPNNVVIKNIDVEDNLCRGYESGSISFTIEGEASITQYAWTLKDETGSVVQTDVVPAVNGVAYVSIEYLEAGIYKIDVVYGHCTLKNYPLGEIKAGYSVVPDVTAVHVHGCNDEANGAIEIEILTDNIGGRPYFYQFWKSNSSGYPNESNWVRFNESGTSIHGLGVGAYDVVVRNNIGCQSETKTVEIVKVPPLIVTYEVLEPITCKGEYGAVEIEISNGSGDYKVSLVPMEEGGYPVYADPPILTNMTLSNITGGVYRIAVVDEITGCMDTLKLDIKAPKEVEIDINLDAPICFEPGVQTAMVEVVVIKPDTGPFRYDLYTHGDNDPKDTFVTPESKHTYTLAMGEYRIVVGMADRACVADTVIKGQIPNLMKMDFEITKSPDENCNYTASMTISIEGGIAPYYYTLYLDGVEMDDGRIEDDTAVELPASGSYRLEVRDVNKCFAYKTEDVELPDGINIESHVHEPLCTNSSKGYIVLVSSNPYTYTWEDYGKGEIVDNKISELDAGTYTVTISDGPCSVRNEYTLIPAYDLSVFAEFLDFTEREITICPDSDLILMKGNVNGEATPGTTLEVGTIAARWESYEGLEFFDPNYPEIILPPGNGKIRLTAEVTVYDQIGERRENCIATSTLTVNLYDAPIVKMIAEDTISIPKDKAYTLYTDIIGGLTETIEWTAKPDYGYHEGYGMFNPVEIISPDEGKSYMLILTVENVHGCKGSDSIFVFRADDFFIPNIFTPNGDGIHDKWQFRNIEQYTDFYVIHVSVYLRSGMMVYSAKGYNNTTVVWDGSRHGQDLPIGTYYYTVHLVPKSSSEGKTIEYKGSVTILR